MQEDIIYRGDKQRRFVIFCYDNHYPAGGTGDIAYSTHSLYDALRTVAEFEKNWDLVELYDLQNRLAEIDIKATNEKIKAVDVTT